MKAPNPVNDLCFIACVICFWNKFSWQCLVLSVCSTYSYSPFVSILRVLYTQQHSGAFCEYSKRKNTSTYIVALWKNLSSINQRHMRGTYKLFFHVLFFSVLFTSKSSFFESRIIIWRMAQLSTLFSLFPWC